MDGNENDTVTINKYRTVLAIWHEASKGKTESVRQFAMTLLQTYPAFKPIFPIPSKIPLKGDFRLIVEINGKIIGVESQGDPGTKLEERLLHLADFYKCEVIICTTRTSGKTVESVKSLVRTRNFNDVWISTYEVVGKGHQSFVNKLKGKHILDLLQSLNVIT